VALLAIGVPLIVAASAALYYLVEKPGIQLGKRIAGQLDSSRLRGHATVS
jgi:peptidoglycan/LPS O-acetylase OafA/YrhL